MLVQPDQWPLNSSHSLEGRQTIRIKALWQSFNQKIGAAPEFITRAPHNVTLFGSPSLYGFGSTLAMAVEPEVLVGVRSVALNKRQIELFSSDPATSVQAVDLENPELLRSENITLSDYIRSV